MCACWMPGSLTRSLHTRTIKCIRAIWCVHAVADTTLVDRSAAITSEEMIVQILNWVKTFALSNFFHHVLRLWLCIQFAYIPIIMCDSIDSMTNARPSELIIAGLVITLNSCTALAALHSP